MADSLSLAGCRLESLLIGMIRCVQADGRLMRDSEEFDGKRWIDSRSSLREPRQGFSLIKVPYCLQMDQSPKFIVSFQGAGIKILCPAQTKVSCS